MTSLDPAQAAAASPLRVTPPTVSVVVPVYEGEPQLQACLDCIRAMNPAPAECIVVDDGSRDASAQIAKKAGCRVLSTGGPHGPAFARNLGARAARSELVLFLDSDVLAPPDLVGRVQEVFRHDPTLDAVIGSYDDSPVDRGFFSQFRNLLHCYVHQISREQAWTFWSGCGAIRRAVFLRLGGFQDSYRRPSIEDIELGMRMRRAGGRIRLVKDLRVTHCKRWSFWRMLRTDIFDRAIPWTLLILEQRCMPSDLNLRWRFRLSAVFLTIWPAAAPVIGWGALLIGAAAAAALNVEFYRFLAARRGWWFTVRAVPVHLLHLFYSAAGFLTGMVLYALRRRERAA